MKHTIKNDGTEYWYKKSRSYRNDGGPCHIFPGGDEMFSSYNDLWDSRKKKEYIHIDYLTIRTNGKQRTQRVAEFVRDSYS